MTTKKGKQGEIPEQVQRGLTKRSTYKVSPDVALELALYDKVGTHGSRNDIIDEALREWFPQNALKKKQREAALFLLEQGVE